MRRAGRSAASDEGDDLDRVPVFEAVVGVIPPGHDPAIDLDGTGTGPHFQGLQEPGHGEILSAVPDIAIDGDSHPVIIGGESVTARFRSGIDAVSTSPGNRAMSTPRAPMRFQLLSIPVLVGLLSGCGQTEYETSTPESVLSSAREMVENGDAHRLPDLIDVDARDIEFEDGVTEESAIAEVKVKLAELLGRLWQVGEELQARFPGESLASLDEAVDLVEVEGGGDWTDIVGQILANPYDFLDEGEGRIEIFDLGDGTAAILWDDEPALGGFIAMVETDDGWRASVPIELVRDTDFWPETRWEWSVVASMLISIENALEDFEIDVRTDRFKSLSQAAASAGRLIGESAVVQAVIYGMMKRDVDDDD